MKKNQKILVAVLAIVIVLAVVIFAIAMNKNTNEEVSSTNDVTSVSESVESTEVESSTEVIASIGTAPEDSTSSIDKSDAINFPGSETEVSTSESNEVISNTNTEVSTSESNTQTSNTKNETSESKTETSASSTSESSTSESSTSKTETSTTETTPVEPTTSESSTTPSTPVDNSSSSTTPAGEQITQGSTGTTSLGTTYPIVSEFNKLGLNPNYDNFFSSDGMSTDFSKAFGQADRSLSDVLGYPSEQFAISATNTYISCLDAHITRQPDKSQYIFTYADNITTDSDGGTIARARHQVMLGAITSTPVEVENALFQAMWGDDPYNIGSNQWVTVGDCKIFYNYGDFENFTFEFLIKPAN